MKNDKNILNQEIVKVNFSSIYTQSNLLKKKTISELLKISEYQFFNYLVCTGQD